MAFTADFESYDFVWFVEVSVAKTLLIKLMEMDGKLLAAGPRDDR